LTTLRERAASLIERGYNIIPIKKGEKRPTYAGWQKTQTTLEDLGSWPAGVGGIGLLTARTPAVDLDIRDAAMATEMEAFVGSLLGDAPVRVGRAPKRLMVFRAGETFRKVTSARFEDEFGDSHQVEILGDGQQFVGYGIHPDTGKPYQWISFEALHDVGLEDLPLLTIEAAREIVAEFERRAAARGWTKATRANLGAGDDDLWFLVPKPDVDDDQVREAMRLLDNPGRDYDLWIGVGAALHNHFEGDPEGLELWLEWSRQSDLHNEEVTEKKWQSFGRYTGRPTTIAFILSRVKDKLAEVKREERAAPVRDDRARIREAIAAATGGDELLDAVLPLVADAKLDPASEQIVLGEISARHKEVAGSKPTVWALQKQVKALRAENSERSSATEDLKLEHHLGQAVLAQHFECGKHIKSFAKAWWEYRRGVWVRTDEQMVRSRVHSTVLGMLDTQDEALVRLAVKLAESRGDRLSGVVSSIFSNIENMTAEESGDDPLNLCASRVPMVINAMNCELWFTDDGKMVAKKHNPSHLLTSQIACNYDPKADCPTFKASLQKVFKSCLEPDDVIRHFCEVFGYIMQPTRHQASWVMLKGPGGNGKSFLLAVIQHIMGTQTVASASISEIAKGANTHFTDSLQGKLLLLDDDLKAGTLLPDDWMKKLSEAKNITANPKFSRAYNFTARCVPVILTNAWPSTVDLSDGLRRRAQIFESNHVLTDEEKNPAHFKHIIEKELPGVLNMLIEGFVRFLKRGQRFDVPWECKASLDTWIASSNPVALFISQCLSKGTKRDVVEASKVYDAYRSWITHWEHNVKPLGRNKFYENLRKMGLEMPEHGNVVMVRGISFQDNEMMRDFFG
jgi:P4 family phage/plasmid primase-like protien